MYTRCPACHTLFRIAPKQLKAARGQVRCGSCQAVFDGLESLVNREELSKEELAVIATNADTDSRQWQLPFDDAPPPEETPATQAEIAVEVSAPAEPAEGADGVVTSDEEQAAPSAASDEETFTDSVAESSEPSAALETEDTAPRPATPVEMSAVAISADEAVETPAGSESSATDRPARPFKWSPRYALSGHEPETAPPRLASRLGWGIGSLLLIALLAAQFALLNRDYLARDLRWRPWLQQFCDMAGCTLAALRDPGAIEMIDRNVQSHPDYQGALLITATLVNQATFAQPYPEVELSMTDLDQQRVAARRFLPAEYLDNGSGDGLIAPGASVRLKLEIADPGQQAVGFEFEFF